MFYHLYQTANKHSEMFKNMVVITGRGYPDNTTRELVSRLVEFVKEVYYLGDYDVYGIDIMLNFSIGN